MDIGCEGVGIFWCLVEMLYEENGYLLIDEIDIYSKSLNSTKEKVMQVIEDYGLFEIYDGKFFSRPLLKRLEHLTEKRNKAKQSASHRWNAKAMRTQCDGNAIKESKERKVSKEKKEITLEEFLPALKSTYTNIDVDSEVKKMRGWILSHPNRTLSKKFATNWLNNVVDNQLSTTEIKTPYDGLPNQNF